jgi:hypothetical protein
MTTEVNLSGAERENLAALTGLSEAERETASAALFNGSATGRLRRACYERLLDHWRKDELPTNATFLFYELEQIGVVVKQRGVNPKTGEHYRRTHRQEVADATMDLRQARLIPWDWLTDETRSVLAPPYAESALDYVIDAARYAAIDAWDGKPPPLIIAEARGVKAVLEGLAYEYGAPITATSGQSGGFIVTEIAPRLADGRIVLYIGDHELRGPAEQIEANTRRYIEEHTGRGFDASTWIRIALTEEQVNEDSERGARLRGLALIKHDQRYKPARPYEAVECEALGQGEIVRIVRDQLDRMRSDLGLEPIGAVRVREERERQELVRRLVRMRARTRR